MESQTLQQQTPVYHVCQHCNGAGCAVCADLCIVEGDLMPINRVIGIKSRYALCQDCLRVLPYTDELHQTEGSCICGGDMCGCSGCDEQAHMLLAGERDPDRLEVTNLPSPFVWSAERGIFADAESDPVCEHCGKTDYDLACGCLNAFEYSPAVGDWVCGQ